WRGQSLQSGTIEAGARLGGRNRFSILGAVFSKVDHRASGRWGRDPGDQQSRALGRQHAGWNWPVTGRKNAAADGRFGGFVIAPDWHSENLHFSSKTGCAGSD